MPAYKDGKKWRARFYYEDYTGHRQQANVRGFNTKKEANAYERDFLENLEGASDMQFKYLWENYKIDIYSRIKQTTYINKVYLVESKILPFFKDLEINRITSKAVIKWQNELLEKGYADTYVKTINNQLSAIFNHAVRHYGLRENPVRIAGSIGKKYAPKRNIWGMEDYTKVMNYYDIKFHNQINNKMYQAIITILFFGGLRIGELLALTKNDFNYDSKILSIDKNMQMIKGKRVISTPKTETSIRTISMPDVVFERLDAYIDTIYGYEPSQLLFITDKYGVNNQLKTASIKCNIPKITAHDLRHSHASLLIKNNIHAKVVQERLGHKDISITLNTYSHLWKSADDEVSALLNILRPN